jgi:hypothetical protein
MNLGIQQDFKRLTLLIIAASVIGVLHIISTSLISKDGVHWIEQARCIDMPKKVSASMADNRIAELAKIQDPGYPLMLLLGHRFGVWGKAEPSSLNWVHSGQILTLFCQILTIVLLYFFGKQIVGGQYAFIAVLILVFLPWPSEFAYDVLREWPYLLFLFGGLFLVLCAFSYRRVIFFLPAGLISGVGHTIRPECAQIVIYGMLGLVLFFINPQKRLSRKEIILASVLLILGFGMVFFPYIQMKGRVLPDKLHRLASPQKVSQSPETHSMQCAGSVSWTAIHGPIVLVQGVSENQMYYFFPFMAAGLYFFLNRKQSPTLHKWFIAGFIIFNCLMYLLLYQRWGYISRRHAMPLAVMTLFFVPIGLDFAAELFSKRRTDSGFQVDQRKRNILFWAMTIVGILICLPKLSIPLGADKPGIRETAEYLKQNTSPEAVIAVFDPRIAFYAERKRIVYKTLPCRKKWDYLVKIEDGGVVNAEKEECLLEKWYSCPVTKTNPRSRQVVVYRRVEDIQVEGK